MSSEHHINERQQTIVVFDTGKTCQVIGISLNGFKNDLLGAIPGDLTLDSKIY